MNLSLPELQPYLNKRVIVTKNSGAQYEGLLNGFRHKKGWFQRIVINRIHLTNMSVLKNGKFYVHSKWNDLRWFKLDGIKSIEVEKYENYI